MKKAVFAGLVLVAGSVPGIALHAEEFDAHKHLTIGRVTIGEASEAYLRSLGRRGQLYAPAEDVGISGELDQAELILDKIINMGRKVWKVAEASRPVVNVVGHGANALPQGLSSWQDIGGWKTPTTKVYRVVYENLYGVEVVDFSFRVSYTHGGNVGGKGRYLTQVTIVPAHLEVSWGFTFNAESSVPSVVNAGTPEAPIAAMELQLKWSVDTVLSHIQGSTSYFVRGDGQFSNLSSGN